MVSSSEVKSSEEIYKKYIEPRIWMKNYDKDVPRTLEIPRKPLFSILDETAEKFPKRTAVIFFGKKIKYADLRRMVDIFARALYERWGVSKGDKVTLLLPNSPQFIIAYYGVIKTGATVSPANPLYTPRELEYHIKKSESRIIVALNLFRDTVETVAKSTNIEAVIYTGIEDFLPFIARLVYKLRTKIPQIKYDNKTRLKMIDLLAQYEPSPPKVSIDPVEDVAALMFTGGTTGIPKAAMLTHYNIIANVYQIDAWWKPGRRGEDTLVAVLPWFHIYGQTAVLHLGILRAATLLVYPRFDLERVMKDIEKYKANVFHGVPTIYSMIVNHPKVTKFNLKSLEVCISGAAPLPVAVAERFEKLTGARLREGYGLTETSPVTHVNPIYGKYKPGSIGLPIPETLAAIADLEKPELLPPGEIGELVISGPQVMKGYYKMPEENEKVFFECCGRRWLRTGDVARMDEEGYFYIVERAKDIIKYKGYSVFPREIEEVLYKHECVAEAAVIGVPDPVVGELIKAFVVLKPECRGKVTDKDIIDYARKNLAPYKVPKEIEFRESLPKSAAGKILRRVLREEELKKRGIS
ncbi:MAG: long-chain fatty acid--CoA ligase [Pyrodictiaceae archaeon]